MSSVETRIVTPTLTSGPPCIMRSIPNWVVWGWWVREDDKIKVPFNPRTGKGAKSNDPSTWGTYGEALARYQRYPKRYAGLGFIFSEGTGIFGIDLDGCVSNDRVSPWASKIMDRFPTYTEISPSGTGVKMFGIGEVPKDCRLRVKVKVEPVCSKTPGLEIYGRLRLFCFTGLRISKTTELHNCETNLIKLVKKIQPEEKRSELSRKNIWRDKSRTIENARKWLTNHGPAISGQDGHTHTYTAALALIKGFELDPMEAKELLTEWNRTCAPPWSERDLDRKIQQCTKVR